MVRISRKCVMFAGKGALITACGLVILMIIIPFIILQFIIHHLRGNFEISEGTRSFWERLPGNRSIIYRKILKTFNLSTGPYFELSTINLSPSHMEAFNLHRNMTDLIFSPKKTFTSGVMLEDFYRKKQSEEEQDSDVLRSKEFAQIRPGVVRAVQGIEAKTEG